MKATTKRAPIGIAVVAFTLATLFSMPVEANGRNARKTGVERTAEKWAKATGKGFAKRVLKTRGKKPNYTRLAGKAGKSAAKKMARKMVVADVLGVKPDKVAEGFVRDPGGSIKRLPGQAVRALQPKNVDRYVRQRTRHVQDKHLKFGHVGNAAKDVDRLTGGRIGKGARSVDRLTGGRLSKGARTVSRTWNRGVDTTARGVSQGYRAVKRGVAKPVNTAARKINTGARQISTGVKRTAQKVNTGAKRAAKKVSGGLKSVGKKLKLW